MSERKVLNKYYPPDFDPSKIPRMKLSKNRQYTVRLMAPFNMRCATCGEYIYKGKKFNARKEDVENEDYLGIRIYRFYIKCTRCLQEISFKTDPQNTDYVIEAGATRNFMALKLAEEQAQREEEERKEEEANNPMKLLEIRTEQSRQEIELLESLEELKELNRRQVEVDYEGLLGQCGTETREQREEREAAEDQKLIQSIKFSNPSTRKIVAEEIIEEVEDDEPEKKIPRIQALAGTASSSTLNNKKSEPKKQNNRSIGVMLRKPNLANLVKKKDKETVTKSNEDLKTINNCKNENSAEMAQSTEKNVTEQKAVTVASGLSLLAGYSDDDDSNEA